MRDGNDQRFYTHRPRRFGLEDGCRKLGATSANSLIRTTRCREKPRQSDGVSVCPALPRNSCARAMRHGKDWFLRRGRRLHLCQTLNQRDALLARVDHVHRLAPSTLVSRLNSSAGPQFRLFDGSPQKKRQHLRRRLSFAGSAKHPLAPTSQGAVTL